MSEELGELIGAVRTFLQVHGRGRHFATGDWEEVYGQATQPALPGEPTFSEPPDPASAGQPDIPGVTGLDAPGVTGLDAPGVTGLDAATDMDALRALWGDCLRCPLAAGRQIGRAHV